MIRLEFAPPDLMREVITKPEAHEMMRTMGKKAMSIILQRTAKGIDANGNKFKPYSRSYYRTKAKSGRNPPDGKGNWLVWTGQLLGSIQMLELTPVTFVIGPAGARTAGPVPVQDSDGGGGNRKSGITDNQQLALKIEQDGRPFIGLSKKEIREVEKSGLNKLVKMINKKG